jgi:hypothetical protein
MPFGSCKNRRFRGKYRTAKVILSLPIIVTLIMEATFSSETSVSTTATSRHIPEDGILHIHRRENLKTYIFQLIISLFAYGAEWNQVQYYCGHLLAYCSSPG